MLFGYIIFVGLPKKCTIPIISFLNKIVFHFGSSGLIGGFLNPSDLVVDVIKGAASLVGTLNQVTGFVVSVAAVEYGATIYKKCFRRP